MEGNPRAVQTQGLTLGEFLARPTTADPQLGEVTIAGHSAPPRATQTARYGRIGRRGREHATLVHHIMASSVMDA